MACPNCGGTGRHFVPPSLGDDGFFACEAFEVIDVKTPHSDKCTSHLGMNCNCGVLPQRSRR